MLGPAGWTQASINYGIGLLHLRHHPTKPRKNLMTISSSNKGTFPCLFSRCFYTKFRDLTLSLCLAYVLSSPYFDYTADITPRYNRSMSVQCIYSVYSNGSPKRKTFIDLSTKWVRMSAINSATKHIISAMMAIFSMHWTSHKNIGVFLGLWHEICNNVPQRKGGISHYLHRFLPSSAPALTPWKLWKRTRRRIFCLPTKLRQEGKVWGLPLNKVWN